MKNKFILTVILLFCLSNVLIAQFDSLSVQTSSRSKIKSINRKIKQLDKSGVKSIQLSNSFLERDTLIESNPKYIEVKRKDNLIRFSFISDTIKKYSSYSNQTDRDNQKMKNAVYMELYLLNDSLIKAVSYFHYRTAKYNEAFRYRFSNNQLISSSFPMCGSIFVSDGTWYLLIAKELLDEYKKIIINIKKKP